LIRCHRICPERAKAPTIPVISSTCDSRDPPSSSVDPKFSRKVIVTELLVKRSRKLKPWNYQWYERIAGIVCTSLRILEKSLNGNSNINHLSNDKQRNVLDEMKSLTE